MKKIKELDVETSVWRFSIEVFEKPDGSGFSAQYWGTTPKFVAIGSGQPTPTVRSSSPKPVARDGDDLDALIETCKQEIKDGFGEIVKVDELT